MSNSIVVCDPTDRLIKTFDYNGNLIKKFEPCGVEDGLACVPTGIHILLNGNICVCDSLNHTVSMVRTLSITYCKYSTLQINNAG